MRFILIISDTLRADHLGCYGNKWISTPHIDAFARESVVFENSYCASFPTVLNRRDLLTGCYTFTYTPWAPMRQEELVLPEMLREAGFVSMMCTDNPHILENGYHFDKGFDGFEWIRGQESDRWKTSPSEISYRCDPSKIRGGTHYLHHRRNASDWQYESDTFTARTMSAAMRWLEKNSKLEEFFLYVDAFDPHEPWDAPQWYVDRYDPNYSGDIVDYPRYDYASYLSKEELRHCRALYAAEVTLIDRWVGQLLQKIKDLGLDDNTTVIFTSDHGFLLGEHGIIGKTIIGEDDLQYIPLYEEINHVPLIVKMPSCKPRRNKALVQPPDVTATIVDLSGAPNPGTMDGTSFAGVLRGEAETHRDFAVSSPSIMGGGSGEASATVIKEGWAGVISGKPIPIEPGYVDRAVDGVSKRFRGRKRPKATIEKVKSFRGETRSRSDLLFRLTDDPEQQKDLAENRPDKLEELRNDFVGLLREVETDERLVEPWL